MPEQIGRRAGAPCSRDRIVDAAIRLYRELGYKKTTVADIARGASMSPANVYRFFPSRRAIEEAVAAKLLEEVSAAATHAARNGGPPLQRLGAALKAVSDLHADRAANDSKLHGLMAAAARENWPIIMSHADRFSGLVRSVITAGQESGELRAGSPMVLTCCLLEAMDAYLSPLRIKAGAVRPTFEEMLKFCAGSLHGAGVYQLDRAVDCVTALCGRDRQSESATKRLVTTSASPSFDRRSRTAHAPSCSRWRSPEVVIPLESMESERDQPGSHEDADDQKAK